LDSIEFKIEEQMVKKIRWIATMRNNLMHKYGFLIDDFSHFDRSCQEVIKYLGLLSEAV
jgi:hypothetical protein